jgi:hypothetical protein
MSTPLDLSEYGIATETDTYAQDEIIDRVTDADTYDSFHGLDLRTLHHSTDNPLNALYSKVIDSTLSLSDRKQAFTYMYHSSYVDKDKICGNALLGLLKDESVSVEDRFHFLNSIRLQSSLLSVPMHGYVWWFYQNTEPLRYRLLAAQFILAHPVQEFPLIKSHFLQSQRFLKEIAEDEKEDIQLRSEAADMLVRLGTPNFRAAGQRVIQQGVKGHTRKTLYDDEQNVHQVSYQSALEKILEKVGDSIEKFSVDQILHHLRSQMRINSENTLLHSACDSFERIVLDTATYSGHSMSKILQYVYAYVQQSPHRVELENRFLEELVEMKGWCSTGHVVRLLNIVSGFDSDVTLRVDPSQEIKSAVFARLGFAIKKLPREQQEEIAEEFCSEQKFLLQEFVETYSPYEELLAEYHHLPREEFEQHYHSAIRQYLG